MCASLSQREREREVSKKWLCADCAVEADDNRYRIPTQRDVRFYFSRIPLLLLQDAIGENLVT